MSKNLIARLFSDYKTHLFAWNILNSLTVAGVTCVSIIIVQSPVKSLLLNFTLKGEFIPAYRGGMLGFWRVMYAGTSSSLTSGALRTLYFTETKNKKPGEANESVVPEASIRKDLFKAQIEHVALAALGDIVVTQIPESLSHLRKVEGLLPRDFRWHTLNNLYQLMSGGFVPRYAVGIVHFTSLFLVEDWFAQHIPVKDKNTKHFISGACSGMTATLCSYPFTAFKDYTLVNSTVNTKGQLQNQTTLRSLQYIWRALTTNPKDAIGTFLNNAKKQLPLRGGLNCAVFGIVAGVGNAMGKEPLKNIIPAKFQPSALFQYGGFFKKAKNGGGADCPKEPVSPAI
ncbi:MAG: hypothetical protein Q8M03_10015 [Legionella sp.]|nr:hypothetical protein [Legionella sp.]